MPRGLQGQHQEFYSELLSAMRENHRAGEPFEGPTRERLYKLECEGIERFGLESWLAIESEASFEAYC